LYNGPRGPSGVIATNAFFESISAIFDIADSPRLLLDPRTLIIPNLWNKYDNTAPSFDGLTRPYIGIVRGRSLLIAQDMKSLLCQNAKIVDESSIVSSFFASSESFILIVEQ
jgi:hypothetical protein